MQNMWISVALIVAVIIVGIIAGKRLSAPGPQRRAVYFAFGTLAVLALWFFIFVAFFPAEWIVPFFTVACIVIPICVYMMVLRSGGKERAKAPSKRSFEIPKKDITVESAKAASPVSSGTASASSATTPSKAATPAPSASQQTAPASSTPSSTAKTDTSSASATKAKAPAAAATASAPAKPAASEAPKATAKPSAEAPKTSAKEAPKPAQAAAKAEAPSTQKPAAESAPVAAPASTKPAESAKSTESQKAKPTKPTKQEAKPASHEAASKPFANKEHVAEIAIEEATEKTPEPPVKATPATTSPSEDQLRKAAEIEILVDRAAEEEAAKIEELVRPFASQATLAMDAEKERELNVGAPVSSPAEEVPTSTEATPAKASSAPAATLVTLWARLPHSISIRSSALSRASRSTTAQNSSRMFSSSSLPTSYSSTTAARPLLICVRLKTARAMLLQLLRQARQQPKLLRLHNLLHLPLMQMAFLTRTLCCSTSSSARR